MTIRNIRKNFLIAIVSSSLLAGAVIAIPFVANAQNGSSEKIISLDDPTNAIEDKQNSETKSEMKQKKDKGQHLIGAVIESLGLEKADIATETRNGSTLGEIAESNGITTEDLISTITSIMTEKLNEAVNEGKITADEALTKASNIQERAEQMVNKPLNQKPGKNHDDKGKGRHLIGAVIESLGLEKADIATETRNGSTLGEIAESNGITTEDLISTITSIMTEKLNEAVNEGKISADEALTKASNIQERAEQMVNKPLNQKLAKTTTTKAKVNVACLSLSCSLTSSRYISSRLFTSAGKNAFGSTSL